MNKKGQALVEFVLILPVVLLILMCMLDAGNIYLEKYKLNNTLDTVATLYQNEKDTELKATVAKEKISFKTIQNGELTEISISKTVKTSAPLLNKVLGDNYTINASKSVYKEEQKEEENNE